MTISQKKKKEQSLNLEAVTWGDLTWVNIERPTEQETEYLAKNYSFHPLDLDDCLSRIQRPKIDEYEEIIEGLNDTHDSLATNRTNEVVRMLTIITTILLPISVVASIYGMNIPLPFQSSRYSLFFVFLIMLAIVSGMLYFFRRQRWI